MEKTRQPFGLNPVEVLQEIAWEAKELGFGGRLVWNYALKADDNFGFSPGGFDGEYDQGDLKLVYTPIETRLVVSAF